MTWRRTKAVARKEMLHILRDWRSLVAALAIPLLSLLLFSYALSLDVDQIPTLIYDQDGTPQARELAERFRGSRYFEIRGAARGYADIEGAVNRNEILLGVVIPRGFARDILAGRQASVQLLVDGSDSNTASLALGFAEALVESYAMDVRVEAQNQRVGGKFRPAVEPRVRVWYNSDLKSRNYIVPGLIAVILMIISALLTSLCIAREWENGTMEQLLSTPVRPSELLLGKLSAYFVLGLVDMLVALVVSVTIFNVPLRGSVLLLFVSSCIFLMGGLCWGIFLSAVARSQLLAFQLGVLTSFLPAFLLSGFVYAIENMPVVIQLVTYIVPARYFVVMLKGIFLKGVGLEVLWSQLLFLTVYSVILFLAASRTLRQKVA